MLLVNTAHAYQAEIKNEYGQTVGYVKETKNNKTEVVDKYGKTKFYIHEKDIVGDKDD